MLTQEGRWVAQDLDELPLQVQRGGVTPAEIEPCASAQVCLPAHGIEKLLQVLGVFMPRDDSLQAETGREITSSDHARGQAKVRPVARPWKLEASDPTGIRHGGPPQTRTWARNPGSNGDSRKRLAIVENRQESGPHRRKLDPHPCDLIDDDFDRRVAMHRLLAVDHTPFDEAGG